MNKFKTAVTEIRSVAVGVSLAAGSLAGSASAFGGDAPTWWHYVTVGAAGVGVVAHAVVAGTAPQQPAPEPAPEPSAPGS